MAGFAHVADMHEKQKDFSPQRDLGRWGVVMGGGWGLAHVSTAAIKTLLKKHNDRKHLFKAPLSHQT